MLYPGENGIQFTIPKHLTGTIIVYFTGSFDILRFLAPLSEVDNRIDDGVTGTRVADENENFFIHVKSYEAGDRMNRMDSIKSSMRNTPFIKTLEYYETGDRHRNAGSNQRNISIESPIPLERKNDLKRADLIHFLLIFLNFATILIQWKNIVLSGLLLLVIIVV